MILHFIITIFAALYVLVMGAFVVYAFHKGWTPWIRNRMLRVERILADVGQKQEHHEFLLAFQREEVTARMIAFRCHDGKTRVYAVDQKLFDQVAEDDHGILLYRGDTFVGFEPAKLATNAEDVYRRMVR